MNLRKLFETQRVLDEHIYEKHPELRGQNNLDWKILALQVELGECANEWRGFKKWSNDQEPRTYVPNPDDLCKACKGQGYTNKHLDIKQWKFCKECDGCGAHYHNPLLEEYVDCLHFILSLGNDLGGLSESFEKSITFYSWEHWSLEKHFFEATKNLMTLQTKIETNHKDADIPTTYAFTLQFVIRIGHKLGFSWDEIEQAYFEKNKINHERQESGY